MNTFEKLYSQIISPVSEQMADPNQQPQIDIGVQIKALQDRIKVAKEQLQNLPEQIRQMEQQLQNMQNQGSQQQQQPAFDQTSFSNSI
jgi:predicted  nucleic acid-binding Zn-ribbon protein